MTRSRPDESKRLGASRPPREKRGIGAKQGSRYWKRFRSYLAPRHRGCQAQSALLRSHFLARCPVMIRAPSMACLVIMGVFSLESPRDAMAQQWGPLGILVSADSSAVDAHRILADGQGGFFAVWRDERTGTVLNTDVYAQRMRSTGEIAAGWPAGGLAVASLPEFQHEANLTSDGEGGILLAWFDTRNIELISADIYVHRVRGDGTLAS